MNILVVDDDPFAGEMTAAVLEGMGHQPVLVDNGVEALERLADPAGGFALIVSDQNMPFLTGIDLFRELRGQGVTIPFILLTGDDPAGPSAQEPNLDACLMKDFTLDERLPEVLDAVMARQAAVGARP
jgi:CheY-like chemotaxis protein